MQHREKISKGGSSRSWRHRATPDSLSYPINSILSCPFEKRIYEKFLQDQTFFLLPTNKDKLSMLFPSRWTETHEKNIKYQKFKIESISFISELKILMASSSNYSHSSYWFWWDSECCSSGKAKALSSSHPSLYSSLERECWMGSCSGKTGKKSSRYLFLVKKV